MAETKLPLYIVEAFTTGNNDIFSGNTAAVCLLNSDDDIDDATKQKIAMNMNLAETAFVSKGWKKGVNLSSELGSPQRWTLRWFTPTTEVPLCGHATLASANVVFHQILKKPLSGEAETKIIFESKFRGELGATLNWESSLITLNFPANPTIPLNPSEHQWIPEIIQATLGPEFSSEAVQEVNYSPTSNITVLVLRDSQQGGMANETILRKVKPDFQAQLNVKSHGGLRIHDVVVTIIGDREVEGPHFYSRFFAIWSGIDEDPVTGVAHTVLAPYWNNEFKRIGVNLSTIVGVQASKRGGLVRCQLVADRVFMTGSTRPVLKGDFILQE